jgi:hypothetical protein
LCASYMCVRASLLCGECTYTAVAHARREVEVQAPVKALLHKVGVGRHMPQCGKLLRRRAFDTLDLVHAFLFLALGARRPLCVGQEILRRWIVRDAVPCRPPPPRRAHARHECRQ